MVITGILEEAKGHMSTEMEVGQSSEIKGESNFKLTRPSMPEVTTYTGAEIFYVWEQVQDLLQDAADWGRGEYQVGDVLQAIVEKRMRLWLFTDHGEVVLAMVTEVLQYPQKKVCNIYAIAGKRMAEMWKLFFPFGRTWLEANEISEIQTTCRDQIAEKISALGFQKAANVMYFNWKELP